MSSVESGIFFSFSPGAVRNEPPFLGNLSFKNFTSEKKLHRSYVMGDSVGVGISFVALPGSNFPWVSIFCI